jgi:hypothetical protein
MRVDRVMKKPLIPVPLNPLSLEGEGWGEGVNAYHCRKNHPSP